MEFPTVQGNHQKSITKRRETNYLKSFTRVLGSVRFLMVVIIIMLGVCIYFFFKPPFLRETSLAASVAEEVRAIVDVNPFETPSVSSIKDAKALRGANHIQAQVYLNANDGDFVLTYSDIMIIYRRETKQIIYQGNSPSTIQTKLQNETAGLILAAAKKIGAIEDGVTAADFTQLTLVNDPDELKGVDPVFYENVTTNDIIAVIPVGQVVLIYRPSTNEIVRVGTYTTTVNVL